MIHFAPLSASIPAPSCECQGHGDRAPRCGPFALGIQRSLVGPHAPHDKKSISQDPDRESESWLPAAQRNVSEWLTVIGMPLTDHLQEIGQFRQGDRDLLAKDYHFQIYEAQFSEISVLLPNVRAEWLTQSELQQLHRRPISPTTRFLVQELAKHNLA